MITSEKEYWRRKRQLARLRAWLKQSGRLADNLEIEDFDDRLEAVFQYIEKTDIAIKHFESMRTACFDSTNLSSPAHLNALPEEIIKARVALGWTQTKMADKLGIKRQQLTRYEKTLYSSIRFSELERIVSLLTLEIEKLKQFDLDEADLAKFTEADQ